MWVSFLVILIVVALVSYTLGTHASQGNASSSTVQTSPGVLSSNNASQYTTTAPVTTIAVPPFPVNVSSVKYFITPSEAEEVIGKGSGSAYESTTPAQLNSTTLREYNISAIYQVNYNNSATNTPSKSYLAESIYLSPKSQQVYKLALNTSKFNFNSTFVDSIYHAVNSTNALNQTVDGMTYSFYSFIAPLPPSNSLATQTSVIGFRNDTFVFLTAFSTNTTVMYNATKLATLAASHLG
jgi:hypothetical protein